MNAREMHYDFKQKLNRIDSQQYRNLKVPEIDWKLNEAQEVFVKMIAEPRIASQLGFEKTQRTVDDIRTIVVNQSLGQSNCITPTVFDTSSFIVGLPAEYWFLIGCKAYGTKGNCANKYLKTTQVEHNDEHEVSPFNRSSFEWRRVNYRFIKEGIRFFTDGTFNITKVCLEYLKKPRLIHNAQDFQGGTYNTLDGTVLTGTQSCELPVMTHREIVDLAVLITAGDLAIPDYILKEKKVKLTT